MRMIPYYNAKLKPIPLLVHYACYVFAHNWRAANGLVVTP